MGFNVALGFAALCSGSAVADQNGASAVLPLSSGTETKALPFDASVLTVAGALPDYAGSGRLTYSLNRHWEFVRGGKEKPANGAKWERVNLPHSVDGVLPEEASGGRNYRGPAWYRRSFDLPKAEAGRRQQLYFEGVMGRCEVWVNGKHVTTHLGGYLPVVVDVTDYVHAGKPNEVLVCTDNSDNPSFPPGKPQDQLDFTYFGGIYRDAFLISTPEVFITDANLENIEAGGGVFFRTMAINGDKVKALVDVHIRNRGKKAFRGTVKAEIPCLGAKSEMIEIAPGGEAKVQLPLDMRVRPEQLWSLENPAMQQLKVALTGADGQVGDARRIPVGIRIIKFTPEGLIINGKKADGKLLGVNRHQDYAQIGHAVPNNLQIEDVRKMHDAGVRIFRLAHTPADPSFLDACDRLGMLVIVPTPGWQYCGKGKFVDYVYSDIRNMIRRDRNHPSVALWEPILNESNFPKDFAKRAWEITHAEYPVPGCAAACDSFSGGAEYYDVLYSHPPVSAKACTEEAIPFDHTDKKAYFTREWGDNVDNWNSHNSSSRASRRWGETPMLVQAKHYMCPDYVYTCWQTLNEAPQWHLGGCLWHSFDHQRGYHPDPFYGGLMDGFRQPKYSYYAFMSQRPQDEPMVYVAHAATPFSPKEVTVFSNCDEVRLVSQDRPAVTKSTRPKGSAMPHKPIVFENAWDFQRSKQLTRSRGGMAKDCIVAEGLIDGKVVCRHEVRPSRRPAGVRLRLDAAPTTILADGSTVLPIVAEVVDANGNVRRLSNESIVFTVEGAGRAVSQAPQPVVWGSAPLLVRVGENPGEIKISARVQHTGTQAPKASKPLKIKTQADTKLQLPAAR